MRELRLLFEQSEGTDRVRVVSGHAIGPPMPFNVALEDEDFEDHRWYLEEFMDLPDGGSIVRARNVEARLSEWGRALYAAVFDHADHREVLNDLLAGPAPRAITVATSDARILRLPWELMADKAGPLFRHDVTIRRQLEESRNPIAYATGVPLRILLVVSRPADAGFIDPRLSSHSMLDALASLGEEVRVDFCRPPTLPRLEEMLRQARRQREPYHIVHFDGHGTFLPDIEVGALCFEKADGATVLTEAKTDYVRADHLGELLTAQHIPLVLLEACRTATMSQMVFKAVAPRLSQAGVGSVVSMGHAVHVEAARILFARFYRELVTGITVGQALEQGRAALLANPHRWIEVGPGGRTVALKDWHLPHLYQRGNDIALVPQGAAEQAKARRTAREQGFEYDAFLSYTHADAARVHTIHALLAGRGLRVFLDERDIHSGPLFDRVQEGLTKSRFYVVACSKASLTAPWVMAEHDMARARDPRGRHILPMVLDGAELPLALKALRWFDFTDAGRDAAGADQLAQAMRSTLAEGGIAGTGAITPQAARFRIASSTKDNVGAFPPPPTYGFHGRARELYELERQLRRHRAVVLHAMGGMGKTTLATEAALWWTRTGLFPDGGCFVSFERFTSAERAIQVLGTYLEGAAFESLLADQQRQRAAELFRDKRVLVVWDNFESVLPQFEDAPAITAGASTYNAGERERIHALFREWTQSPDGHGRLLITCRPGKTDLAGARHTELGGLQRADSLWLLVRVLETAGVDLEDKRLKRESLGKLLDLLRDHPLSIELVGPHLKQLTPEQVIADFGQLLQEFKRGEGKERNESLLASLAFSTSRLSAAAQAALSWLAMFSGGVFEHILLAISQVDPAAWKAIRGELEATALIRIDWDLLLVNRPYLRFHPTLAYAAMGVVPDPKEARRRFVWTYVAFTSGVARAFRGSNPRKGLEAMIREEANCRRAVVWAVEDQEYFIASDVGDTFRAFLERAGRLRERDEWVLWLFDEVQKGGFSASLAERECDHAWTLVTQGDAAGAIRRLGRLRENLLATTVFDSEFQLALTDAMLGRVLDASGQSPAAVAILQSAVDQWETVIARIGQADAQVHAVNLAATLGDLANALMAVGRLDEAMGVAERVLTMNRELGSNLEVGAGLGRIAQILRLQGLYADAEVCLIEALEVARLARDKRLKALTLQHQGSLASDMRQFEPAARLYRQALELFQETSDYDAVVRTYNLLGVAAHKQGRLSEARAWYERTREVAAGAGQKSLRLFDLPGIMAQAAQNIGIVCQEEGELARKQGWEREACLRFEEAKLFFGESLTLERARDNEPREAESLSQLARIHVLLGELDAAEDHAHRSREIREPLGLKEVSHDYHTLAEIAHKRGNPTDAAAWERKRDAILDELERRAGGGLSREFLKAVQQLAVACAQTGFGSATPATLDPNVASALAQVGQLPAPMPDLAAFLRDVAIARVPAVPTSLPPEIREILDSLVTAIRSDQR